MSLARSDQVFASDFHQADICHADGMSIVIASRYLTSTPLPERISTTDFFHDAAAAAEEAGLSFYFLGGSEITVQAAYSAARKQYPKVIWAGCRHGYFEREDEANICREIVSSGADVVWVGLGRPLQEAFCIRNKSRLRGVSWLKTCGGLFDFLAGNNKRAPDWVQGAGLEWAFRTLLEPRRLAWRYATTVPHSLVLLATSTRDVTQPGDVSSPAVSQLTSSKSDLQSNTTRDAEQSRRVVLGVSFLNNAGAQLSAYRLAKGLQERGWAVEMWFLYKLCDCDFNGVPTRVFYAGQSPRIWGYSRIVFAVLIALRRARPAAVISFLPLASAVLQSAARLLGVRRRVASLRSPPNTFSPTMQLADKLCGSFGVYTDIVAVSRQVAEQTRFYPHAYQQKVRVVYNGVARPSVSIEKSQARQMLGIPIDRNVALLVGRVSAQKNYQFVLKIAEHIEHSHIVCVGDGPDKAEIFDAAERLNVNDRVTFLGQLEHTDMPLAYAAADVFISPSLYEGQSNALLEAMAMGLAVVVSDVATQVETVFEGHSVCGLVLPLDDAKQWAREIDGLVTDASRRLALSEQSLRRAAHFSVRDQIDGFERTL
ncbi:MAG: WecB/TagA/CpsF family glycosyltransferase, partial [Pseudomonadota bacterium]